MNIPKVRPKLKKNDIDIATVYYISKQVWYTEKDDKAWRSGIDIKSARLVARKNFEYNRSTKKWEPKGKRHIKFEFVVSSEPVSYEKIDSIKIHRYPVVFLFYDIERGFNSPFRWRTGSLRKLQTAKKGSSKQERKRIAENNIKNGVQPQFVFEEMWTLNYWGLLYGPLTCMNKAPLKTNPHFWPAFDKHAYFIVEKILNPLFKNEKFLIKMGEIVKND